MYEEDKNLIAYCGLYCGNCINYKGEIADLARDLRKKLREAKFTRIAQGLSKFFKVMVVSGEIKINRKSGRKLNSAF